MNVFYVAVSSMQVAIVIDQCSNLYTTIYYIIINSTRQELEVFIETSKGHPLAFVVTH